MKPIGPEFIGEIARQLASVSAFLGGFAATFLGILLQSQSSRRLPPFGAGIYANLLSLGLSGWIRSRSLDLVTSSAALLSGGVVPDFRAALK